MHYFKPDAARLRVCTLVKGAKLRVAIQMPPSCRHQPTDPAPREGSNGVHGETREALVNGSSNGDGVGKGEKKTEEEFVIGPLGMWKVLPGKGCQIMNRCYAEVVVHGVAFEDEQEEEEE